MSISRKVTTGFISLALAGGAGIGLASTASAASLDTEGLATHGVSGTVRFINSPDRFANVRSGPGVGFKVIGRLDQCTKVVVVKTCDGWSKLSTGGWVANWLLSTKPVNCKLPGTGCPGKPGPCSPKPPCGNTCPPPAPKCLWRVVIPVGGKCPEQDARALAAKIGGGAFVRQINGKWFVQVGAFASRANADARADAFRWAFVLDCA